MDNKEVQAAIRLSGSNILDEHCYFENVEGTVMLHSMPNSITVRDQVRGILES